MTPPTIKGVLFDKDGTLFDFYQTWMPAYRAAADMVCELANRPDLAIPLLEAGGYQSAVERIDPTSVLACGSNDQIAEVWARVAGIDDWRGVAVRLEEVFSQQVNSHVEPVVDLRILFAGLRERSLCVGVATMDSEASARRALGACGALDLVDFLCGFDSGYGTKPDAGMVEAFCRHCGFTSAEVMVVGDTRHDMEMGRAAGAARVIGVLTGPSPRSSLAPLADQVIPSIASLDACLTAP